MKKLILSLCFVASVSFAADPIPVFSDGTNTFWGTSTNTLTQTLMLCQTDVSQAFTAAAGYEVVTNFTSTMDLGDLSNTHSNVTVGVTGWYYVIWTVSFSSSAANTVLSGHTYTNGVTTDMGWEHKLLAIGDVSSAAGQCAFLLTAGSTIDFRWDTDKNATLTMNHQNIKIEMPK
jgi:hypothetical protein